MNRCTAVLILISASALAGPSELFLRGRAVIPTPRQVTLGAGEVRLDGTWTVDGDAGIALRSLLGDLREWHGLELKAAGQARNNVIGLRIREGAIAGTPTETRGQAYRLTIMPGRIEITGNAAPGLFYGVQTLLQLVKTGAGGAPAVPECVIEDWPRLALRFLHWDTKHHQDRMDTLKRYLDWAARFKANMIGFELEDKFSYPSNPVIGAPGAFTPAELQEIVNYGLERYIQVVPVVQSPAHFSYVLKHPQFAHLRADGNNYMADLCQEETYKLIFRMYDDVIEATRGIDYFFVSTDEIYYAGIGPKCSRPYTRENRSATWADFAIRARDHLAMRGRRMLAWLEYPLMAKDLERIPADVIDGVVGDDAFVEIERRKGMRQLVYVSTQGSEFLFPNHLEVESMGSGRDLTEFEQFFTTGRLPGLQDSILNGRASKLNPIGVFGAAWDDSGLHNETFWLAWAAVARWGWNPGVPGPEQHAVEFMDVYYGPGMGGLVEVYRAMERQARAWQLAWERVISRVRGPGYGNSEGKGQGTARHDLTLAAPGLPDATTLAFKPAFAQRYKDPVAAAPQRRNENDRLQHALLESMLKASRNRYNLEVMLALARFTGHHWNLLIALAQAEQELERAASEAAQNRPGRVLAHLAAAYNAVARVQREGDAVGREITAVFEKSRWPKGRSVGGRKYVHVLDDSKDHWAARTADMGFLFAPERGIGLDEWRAKLAKLAGEYAARNNVPFRGLSDVQAEQE